MNLPSVAASRESAAILDHLSLRRSYETPLQGSSWSQGAHQYSWRLSLIWLCLLVGCASPQQEEDTRFEFAQPQMGVSFRVVLYAPDKAKAQSAAAAAFDRIQKLNDILSDYDPDSELSRLSQTAGQAKAVPVGADLWQVLSRAQILAERSEGAFDVTVGPVVTLWRKARRENQLPKRELLAEARAAVGFQKMQLDARRHTVELRVPGMRLDVGGIAKGYAVDEALAVLRAQGVRRALVSGGGDLAVSDPPPGQKGWRIQVAALDVVNAPAPPFVFLANAALATSGDVFQHLEVDGQRYSHIVDPHTGLGLTDHSQVTVIARDCTTADGLATAVSVLGPASGLQLVARTPRTAAYIVRQPQEKIEIHESPGFKKFDADTR